MDLSFGFLDWDDTGYELRPLQRSTRRQDRSARRQVRRASGPVFAEDQVTRNDALWKRSLGHLRHADGVAGLVVGAGEGRSTAWFLQNILTAAGSRITCIDTWATKPMEIRFDHNMVALELADRVRKLKGPPAELIERLEAAGFGLAHLIGNTGVLVQAWSKLVPDGVLILDELTKQASDHVSGVIERSQDPDSVDFDVLHQGGNQVILRKRRVDEPKRS